MNSADTPDPNYAIRAWDHKDMGEMAPLSLLSSDLCLQRTSPPLSTRFVDRLVGFRRRLSLLSRFITHFLQKPRCIVNLDLVRPRIKNNKVHIMVDGSMNVEDVCFKIRIWGSKQAICALRCIGYYTRPNTLPRLPLCLSSEWRRCRCENEGRPIFVNRRATIFQDV